MATTTHVSRRSILTAALAGSALAAAPLTFAQASEPDPVFAAIDAYRAAYDAHIAAFDATEPYEDAYLAALKSGDEDAISRAQEELRRPEAALAGALRGDSEAWWDLTQTVPTTPAGLLAYARFFAERDETLHAEQSGGDAMQTIADALEILTAASHNA